MSSRANPSAKPKKSTATSGFAAMAQNISMTGV